MNTFAAHVLERLNSIATAKKLATMQIDRHPAPTLSTTPWSHSGDFIAQDRKDGQWRTVARLKFTFRDGEGDSKVELMGFNAHGAAAAQWVAKSYVFRPWDDAKINEMFEGWRGLIEMAQAAQPATAAATNGGH